MVVDPAADAVCRCLRSTERLRGWAARGSLSVCHRRLRSGVAIAVIDTPAFADLSFFLFEKLRLQLQSLDFLSERYFLQLTLDILMLSFSILSLAFSILLQAFSIL